MKKQIEEMAKDIYSILRIDTMSRAIASMLYGEGYRKSEDVAREIFEEIEEIFNKRIAFYTEMAQQSKFTEDHYAETVIKNCEIYLEEIAELKKKYTEGE